MLHIKFKYQDEYTKGEWSYQECYVNSIQECISFYGLNDCRYEILSVEKVVE